MQQKDLRSVSFCCTVTNMKQPERPKSTVYVGAQLEKELYAKLEEYADSRGLKMAEALRRAVRRLLGAKS